MLTPISTNNNFGAYEVLQPHNFFVPLIEIKPQVRL